MHRAIMLLILACVIACGYNAWIQSPSGPSYAPPGKPQAWQLWNVSASCREWPTRAVASVERSRMPVLVRGSFVSQWRAMAEWPHRLMTGALGEFVGVRWLRSGAHWYVNHEAGNEAWLRASAVREGHHGVTPVTAEAAAALWERWSHANGSQEQQQQGRVAHVTMRAPPPVLRRDCVDAETVFGAAMASAEGRHGPPADVLYSGVWMGEPGATTAAHYDPDVNFYVQVSGSKVFHLWPPGVSPSVPLAPRLCPAHKHVRIRDQPCHHPRLEQCYEGHARTPFACITLQPGDVLVLPAYVLHHVVAGDAAPVSASVNFWYTPTWARRMLDSQRWPFPLEQGWEASASARMWSLFPPAIDASHRYAFVALHVVSHVVRRVTGGSMCDFLALHVMPRYHALRHLDGPPSPPEYDTRMCSCTAAVPLPSLEPLVAHIRSDAVTKQWIDVYSTAPLDVARIELGNWVELTAVSHVTQGAHVAHFVRHCWPTFIRAWDSPTEEGTSN